MGDALGSVCQLTESNGAVVFSQSYQPYGDVLSSVGSKLTDYGFTGEWGDASGLIFLRARYYAPRDGRFLSKDVWDGNPNQPMSYNPWLYAFANPIMLTDPSGMIPKPESPCDRMPPDDAYWCRLARECDEDPDPLEYPIPPDPTYLCDAQCMYEATTPLSDWRTIHSFSNPKRAAAIRLLLSEMAWRFLTNRNWKTEAIGSLWTVKNRVEWEIQRKIYNDNTKHTRFTGCVDGFVDCAFASGQYATTASPRGRDPLYLDPDEPGRRRSYYHDEKYIAAIINRAVVASREVLELGALDPTLDEYGDGAHFFSHNPETVFTKKVDLYNDERVDWKVHTITIPYVGISPGW